MPPTQRRVRLSTAARRDFAEIIRWTTKTFGGAQARRYGDAINSLLGELVAGPELPGSRARPDLGVNVRVVVIARQGRRARQLLVYCITKGSDLEIIRILHDAMDVERHVRGAGSRSHCRNPLTERTRYAISNQSGPPWSD